MVKPLFPTLMAALAVIALARFGLFERFGAHPFWAVKTALTGTGIGAVAGLGLAVAGVRQGRILVLGLVIAIICYGAAITGAARFAASYAEDVIAGKFWFFGWIGVAAALTLAGQAAIALFLRRAEGR